MTARRVDRRRLLKLGLLGIPATAAVAGGGPAYLWAGADLDTAGKVFFTQAPQPWPGVYGAALGAASGVRGAPRGLDGLPAVRCGRRHGLSVEGPAQSGVEVFGFGEREGQLGVRGVTVGTGNTQRDGEAVVVGPAHGPSGRTLDEPPHDAAPLFPIRVRRYVPQSRRPSSQPS